ncbi:LOG family protein, partial [Streptococcus pyogenes]
IAHEGLNQLIVVEDMHQRKAKMMDLSQVFIALPGGPGTLEEIAEVISWVRVGQCQGPCILYNINGYWDCLKMMFDQM